MNTARTITIIDTGEETVGGPITHESPAIYDAGTPVGRILAAMCDGGDIIENRQGLTRITIAADEETDRRHPGMMNICRWTPPSCIRRSTIRHGPGNRR